MGLLLVGVVGVALQLNATTLYVDANNGNDDNDGLDWSRAAKTIQHAVYIAQSNDVIVVNDGVYESFITSNATIAIESVNGAEKTVVDGGGTNRCFSTYGLKLTNSVVRGFTFRNGLLPNGAGGATYGGTMIDCIYTNNTCGFYGGGAYGGKLIRCKLYCNSGQFGGGACDAELQDCILAYNVATNGAGAYGGTLRDCLIFNNTAESYGGGTDEAVAYNCVYRGNTGSTGGGASYSELSGCIVSNNYATTHGGGMYYGSAENCTISFNAASYYGGGTCLATVRKSSLVSNEATYGGGVCDGEVSDCEIVGNTAYGYGGGAYQSVVDTSWIDSNSAYVGGGTYYGTVRGCVVCNNEAQGAGGGAGFGRLINCTVVWNYAYDIGGGMYKGNLHNSIVWANEAGNSSAQTYGVEVVYSCLPESVAGEGNLVADPKFRDLNRGDFQLMEDSPCINAGTDYSLTATDINGDRRVKYGTVDMGAYETTLSTRSEVFVEEVVGGCVTPESYSVEAGGTMTFTAAGPRPFIGFYTNGVFITSDTVLVLEDVRITGTLEARFDTSVPATIYVNASTGNDANSGANEANAKASIVGAARVACNGDLILVAPGTYAPFTVANLKVTIRSTQGAAATVVDASLGDGRCATLADENALYYAPTETNTVLIGFTLKNGQPYAVTSESQNYNRGGGVYGGTVIDCVFNGNTCSYEGGAAVCSVLAGCRIYGNYASQRGGGISYCRASRCVIEGNWTGYHGGGIYKGESDDCLVRNNNAQWGGGAASAKLVNCTVVGNTSTSVGGGCHGCTVVNSIVKGNTASANADVYNSIVTYSCTDILQDGVGNIAADPSFVSPETSNYRLSVDSCCAEIGSVAEVVSSTDLDGKARIVNGKVSLGAYAVAAKPVDPPDEPDVPEFETAWGGWSEAEVRPEVLATTRFTSMTHFRSTVWQLRDAMSVMNGNSVVPPSANPVVLTLGQFTVPQSFYADFVDDVEAYEEYGVPVWHVHIRESDEDGGRFIATIGDVEIMTEQMPFYDRQKWSSYVYGNPPSWLSGEQLEEWYASRSRKRIECFLTLIPEDQYGTYLANKAEDETARNESGTNIVCLDGIQPNVSTCGLHCVGVHLPSAQAVGLFGTSDISLGDWSYYGLANFSNGTSTAGVSSKGNAFFVTLNTDMTDSDGDGIPNALETNVYKTDPHASDTSGGGISDWEKIFHYGLDPKTHDTDGDGISDEEEILAGTDPFVAAPPQEQERNGKTIRYFYDDDDRLIGTYIGNGGEKSTTVLSPAGNPLEISERRAK